MDAKRVCVAGGLVLLGFLVGASVSHTKAQSEASSTCEAAGAWTIASGHAAAEGGFWYAVKLNRCTGETFLLGAYAEAKDEKWYLLPTAPVGR